MLSLKSAASVVAVSMFVLVAACGGGADLAVPCEVDDDCPAELACKAETGLCSVNGDGDGDRHRDGGSPAAGTVRLAVTLFGDGVGHVTSNVGGIECPGTCAADFIAGAEVTLSAIAGDSESTFRGWSGDCSGTADCTLTVTATSAVGAAFEAAPCDVATSVCLPPPPPGWSVPLALFDGPRAVAAADCPPDYPVEEDRFADVKLSGACGACDCEPATGVQCKSSPTIATGELPAGSSFCPGASGGQVASAGCHKVGGVPFRTAFVQYEDPGIRGGSCAPVQSPDTLGAEHQTRARICSGAAIRASGCGVEQLCAPTPPDGFSVCIAQAGEHPCPLESGYTAKLVRYLDLRDDRACECTCGDPSGTCGTVSTRVRDPNGEAQQCFGGGSSSVCAIAESKGPNELRAIDYQFTAAPTGSCESAQAVVGGIAQLDPVTYCCLL